MSIIYSLVARGEVTLVEYDTATGNHPLISREVVKRVPPEQPIIYQYNEDHLFVCLNENKITYLVLIDAKFSKAKALGFLKDTKDDFTTRFSSSEVENAVAYGFQTSFGQRLEQKTKYYNEVDDDKIVQLKKLAEETTQTLMKTMDDLFEREGKLELIAQRSMSVESSSVGKTGTNRKEKSAKEKASLRTCRNSKNIFL